MSRGRRLPFAPQPAVEKPNPAVDHGMAVIPAPGSLHRSFVPDMDFGAVSRRGLTYCSGILLDDGIIFA
jgi:hypothetical protein